MVERKESSEGEQRPPVYNAEDYLLGLRKYGRKSGSKLYISGEGSKEKDKEKRKKKDYRNPNFNNKTEMSLRQFSNVSELLKKLKLDLKMSFPSFVKEFVSDPFDGVTALLDVLKMIQLSQTDYAAAMTGTIQTKEHHLFFRRALADEYDCLLCLRFSLRSEETAHKFVNYPHGLYTVAVCVMSNFSKSRTLALELLTEACGVSPRGHRQVLEAASTLRLRFGEPVRFKFLVGMLNSYGLASFQLACLRFLNKLVDTAEDQRERVYLQAEIEEAGFDPQTLKKFVNQQNHEYEYLREQLSQWCRNYLDVNVLAARADRLAAENEELRREREKLQEQKMHVEDEHHSARAAEERMRNKCSDLEKQNRYFKQQLHAVKREYEQLQAEIEMHRNSEKVGKEQAQQEKNEADESMEKREETDDRKKNKVGEGKYKQKDDNTKEKEKRQDYGTLDYEKEKVCEEMIEVENDTILYDPTAEANNNSIPKNPRELYQNQAFVDTQKSQKNQVERRKQKKETEEDKKDKKETMEYEEDEDEATIDEVMEELRNIINNAESSLSLVSVETVKLAASPEQQFEDRASPNEPMGDDIKIVPTRLPQAPARPRTSNSGSHSGSNGVLFFDEESPSETSDTESMFSRIDQRPSSAVESESTKSFGFIRPSSALRRRETFTTDNSEQAGTKRSGLGEIMVKRSESFHHDANRKNYSPRQNGSLEPRGETEGEVGRRKIDGGERRKRFEELETRRRTEDMNGRRKVEDNDVRRTLGDTDERRRSDMDGEGRRRRLRRREEDQFSDMVEERMERWLVGRNKRLHGRYPDVVDPAVRRHVKPGPSRGRRHHDDVKTRPSNGGRPPSYHGEGTLDYNLAIISRGSNFITRGHSNADLYSEEGRYAKEGELRIPSPDYSSSSVSTVVKLNISNRLLDLPSGLY